jgi:hypothetical protein
MYTPLIWKRLLSPMFLLLFVTIGMSGCTPATEQENKQVPETAIPSQPRPQVADTSANRPVFPGGDTIQLTCEFIQDQAEVLLEEYYQPDVTRVRARQVIKELQKLNKQWMDSDCQQVFGFMVPNLPSLPASPE